MGHFLFLVLHLVALLFGAWFLILTIPPHLIYSAIASRNTEAKPQYVTHVRCAACIEYVLRDASKCKHCGSQITPQPLKR